MRNIFTAALVLFCVAGILGLKAIGQTSKAKVPNPEFAAIEDKPGLPRVLLIGDSISMGYTLPVRELLKDRANVHRIPTNGGPTTNGLKHTKDWLGTSKWDVIHFNWGLHDLKYIQSDPSKLADPKAVGSHRQVDLPEYETNMRELVAKLQATGAKLIWCETTPVPQGSAGRIAGDEIQYNEVAARIMKEAGIPINELHSYASAGEDVQLPANVHYTPAGSKYLANQVAAKIKTVLPKWIPSVGTENWPGWRGPRGDGTSQETAVPTRWNGLTGENIAWKVELPGRGHSSPVVWNDQVFVAACIEESNERILMCFDRQDGKQRWQSTVIRSMLESKHQLNSYASGTPVTDGETIYVTFLETDGTMEPAKNVGQTRMITVGNMVVAAYDMQGKQQWITRPSRFSSAHGYCSSPVIHKNRLIVNGDHDGESNVLALDRKTGEVVWKFPRIHQTRSYCTPIIREVANKTQMVLSGSKQVVSLDPDSGKLHWSVEGPTEQFVASMVFDGDKFYLAAGFPDYFVMAIRPDGSGDVSKSHVAWSSPEAKCYVPSPVLTLGQLFVVDDRGTISCFDTKSGERLWRDRLGGHYSASLVTANGLVYCTSDEGIVRVIQPGPELKVVAENPLGENSFASPAISQGQIFIRGEKQLYAIGK